MGRVKYVWSKGTVGERLGPEIPEEGDRARPYSAELWSRVEGLPPERTREIQIEKLRFLLDFAYNNSRFYRERWDAHGVKPSDIRGLEDLTKLPIVTKYDFDKDQRAHPPYGTVPTRPPGLQMKHWQTSGTTARPRLWMETGQDWENAIEYMTRSLYAYGVRSGWRGYFAFGFPPFIGFWIAFAASEALGCQNIPKGAVPTEAWLTLMSSLAGQAPSFVCCTPTYAVRQLEAARKRGIDPHDLKIDRLILAGEPGASIPATNRLLKEGWNAQVHEYLGSTETNGPILYSCEYQAQQPLLCDHIMADYFLVELVDPESLEPVKGNMGVSCVTSLSRFGMPAIRFLLGDFMEIDNTRCGCGRTSPLARGGVVARADDMLIVRGVKIYPSLIEDSVRSLPGLSPEYRLKRRGDGLQILVEAEPSVPDRDYERLKASLQEDIKIKTLLTVDIEVTVPGTLPREEAKTKRIIL